MVSPNKRKLVPPSPFYANPISSRTTFPLQAASPPSSLPQLCCPPRPGDRRGSMTISIPALLSTSSWQPPGREHWLHAALLWPSGKADQHRRKPNAWFTTPSLTKRGQEQLWGWEKPAPRAGPDQAVPETPRQHSRQCETHRAERPSAATSGRGKS